MEIYQKEISPEEASNLIGKIREYYTVIDLTDSNKPLDPAVRDHFDAAIKDGIDYGTGYRNAVIRWGKVDNTELGFIALGAMGGKIDEDLVKIYKES